MFRQTIFSLDVIWQLQFKISNHLSSLATNLSLSFKIAFPLATKVATFHWSTNFAVINALYVLQDTQIKHWHDSTYQSTLSKHCSLSILSDNFFSFWHFFLVKTGHI